MQKITLSILTVATLLGLSACGSDEKQPINIVTPPPVVTNSTPGDTIAPTKGQQLTDLKKAYDDGTITHDEYKEQKARILD